jgi:hypothetical protein
VAIVTDRIDLSGAAATEPGIKPDVSPILTIMGEL